jgi:diguanylate cyclase (GGDEF)-like protein
MYLFGPYIERQGHRELEFHARYLVQAYDDAVARNRTLARNLATNSDFLDLLDNAGIVGVFSRQAAHRTLAGLLQANPQVDNLFLVSRGAVVLSLKEISLPRTWGPRAECLGAGAGYLCLQEEMMGSQGQLFLRIDLTRMISRILNESSIAPGVNYMVRDAREGVPIYGPDLDLGFEPGPQARVSEADGVMVCALREHGLEFAAAMDHRSLYRDLHELVWVMVGVLVLVLGLSMFVARSMAHRLLAGLSELTRRARAISRKQFDQQSVRVGASEELMALEEAFDTMSAEIRRYTDDLERLVAERTLELEEKNRELEHIASTDTLTGVLNRRSGLDLLDKYISLSEREKRTMAVCFLDLDGLKEINDSHGHAAGDMAIKALADSVRSQIRATDFVSRLGGDEFLVVLAGCGEEDAREVISSIRACLDERADELPCRVGFSCGIMERRPGAGTGVEDILAEADKDMYQAKKNDH